jgi:hypothetical protein
MQKTTQREALLELIFVFFMDKPLPEFVISSDSKSLSSDASVPSSLTDSWTPGAQRSIRWRRICNSHRRVELAGPVSSTGALLAAKRLETTVLSWSLHSFSRSSFSTP